MRTVLSTRRPLYVQCPSFGFGPASTMAFLLDALGGKVPIVIVGHGPALSFLLSRFPMASCLEVDVSTAEGLHHIRAAVPSSSLFVSNTDPVFAAWALGNGYRVGVVDTLDWMWNEVPLGLSDAEFHLVQWFFGSRRSASAEAGLSSCLVAPLVRSSQAFGSRPTQGRTEASSVVITFGGMTVPRSDGRSLAYARWVLSSLLSPEVMNGVQVIHVVGGLPGLEEAATCRGLDGRVQVHVALAPDSLQDLYANATHIVATPGLTTIYELASMGAEALLLPGFSMSMLLQARALATSGYEHVAEWDWALPVCDSILGLPEEEGLALVASRLDQSVTETNGDWVARAFARYRLRTIGTGPLRINIPAKVADPAELFAQVVAETLAK